MPSNIVERYRDVLRAEQVNNALFMIDDLDYGSPSAEQVRAKIKRLAEEMARGRYDFKPVDEQIESDCAAVIVRENPDRAGQFVAFYLVRRDGLWKIAPEATRFESIRGATAAQMTTFKVLEKWFLLQKSELIAGERRK